ncbi:MAG: beta-galactosidase [Planctomycetia bacterium]|nr:beta-galactosidase [Planctomycetia bacterium]
MSKRIKLFSIATVSASAFLLACGLSASLGAAENSVKNTDVMNSPYGTCSHLAGGQEHDAMPQNMVMMKKAGIDWARADFSWSGIERTQGTWNFEHLDKVMKNAEEQRMQILPILDYHTSWADPAYKHPEAWLEYVRRTVTHFKDKIRYWEVWNEQNLKGFWHDTPDPVAYAEFLKKTYTTIKEIDPDLQVVYGGLAGVPRDFYEKSLQAGCGKYFDVINIHPYRGGLVSQSAIITFKEDIQAFHDLTVKYCGEDKPLWITEMGWATPPVLGRNAKCMISGSLAKVYPDGVPGKIGVIVDYAYTPANGLSERIWSQMLPEGTEMSVLKMADLKKLDPKTTPVLVMPPGEDFPTSCSVDLQNYVKNGGTLVLIGGVPFYYHNICDENGVWSRPKQNPYAGNLAHDFRVSWIAWWTEKGTPETTKITLAPGMNEGVAAEMMKSYPADQLDGTRFFTDSKLKPGDVMEPILLPVSATWMDGEKKGESFNAPCACIYRFNSDWKGNIIVSAVMGDTLGNTNRCMEENQGIYLSQAILLALANGVDRYFSYEFQAVERDDVDPEHHFGLMHSDLTPKSGYNAYKALTTARPAGSVNVKLSEDYAKDNLVVLAWKRPDGQNGWAIWAPTGTVTKKVKISGKVTESFNYLGEKVDVQGGISRMVFSDGITYIIGKNVTVNFGK